MTAITITGNPDAPTGGAESIGPLAAAMTELETRLEAERPEAVVLADDSDRSLAAALVATKLLIPVRATADASSAATANGRLIAQLADAYTAPA